jgi:sugar phosphate isomerase/epimerase
MRAVHLGLAQGLVPEDPDELTPDRARAIAALGVTRVVTHFTVPAPRLVGRGPEIAAILADAGIRVAQCGGLAPNLVSPDAAVRAHWIARLAELLALAQALDAQMMLTGCGSHHPTFSYGPAPENHTSETRERLVESLRELARHAEDAGVPVALECHVLTTLDTAEHVREIFDAVDSPWIGANFDPVNFLGSLPAVFDSGNVARHVAATIGPRFMPAVHVKDVVVEPDLVLKISEAPPGTGIMDLDGVMEACRSLPPESALIVEHFGPEESAAALRHVGELARRHGLLA